MGFGIFMSRIGAVGITLLGGVLLDWGGDSVVPFFVTLTAGAILVSAAAFVVDRHVPPASRGA
jgi:AAHS family 4-hydroxybenzoate transporter-like MFS transporter